MTSRDRLAALLLGAAFVAAPAPAVAQEADPAQLRAAMERAYVAAESDHAKARAHDFAEKLGSLPEDLLASLRSEAAERTPDAGRVLQRIPAKARPLSDVSMRVVLARLLGELRDDDEASVRERFLAAAREVFSEPRFEDCWDRAFQDLPEVAAWRASHAPRAGGPPGPKAGNAEPEPAPAPKDPAAPPSVDVPAPSPAPKDLPSPFVPDATLLLVPLDRGRNWVGPWTGWTQEIPEKDNKRQKRPAKAVWIDRYEVTCADYLRFLLLAEPSKRRALLPAGWSIDERLEPACPPGRERTPVTGVTFAQAQAYAEAAGKRLPTEDEWDRAAGGGERDARAFPWGGLASDHRWAFAGTGAEGPVAVDSHPDDRTAEGVVGLAGNVAEMVATLPDRRDVPAKLAPGLQIVVRGGSYRTSREADCGTTFRWVLDAAQSAAHVGFRCVMDEAEYRRRFR